MNPEAYTYPRGKQLTLAGLLALAGLLTAVIYACRATPYTMVLFLGFGSALLFAAALLFGWTIWRDVGARLHSLVSKEFAPGQVIYSQGETPEHVYVIVKGQVEAVYTDPSRGDVIVGHLGPNDYFGESAILTRVPRQVTMRAVDVVEVFVIHRMDFLRVYTSLPRLRARVEAELAKRKALINQLTSTKQSES
jgi:hypothetical protein